MQCENSMNNMSGVREAFRDIRHVEHLDTARQEFLGAWFNAVLLGGVAPEEIADEIIGTLAAMEQLASMAEGVENTHEPPDESISAPRKKSVVRNIPWVRP